jgi:hypothetical protein
MLKAYYWRILATLLIGLAAIHLLPALVLADNPIYLPLIFRSPPSILYYDNFSNSKSGWRQNQSGDCQSAYLADIYGGQAKEGNSCYYPAPSKARYVQGQFQVQTRRYKGSDHFSYGLYLNGEGTAKRYLFKVQLRGKACEWQLVRRENNQDHTVQSGNCDAIYKGSGQFNTLKISRNHNNELALYLNNQLLNSYLDGAPLTGQETGLYLSEESEDEKVEVIFDNFTIYQP